MTSDDNMRPDSCADSDPSSSCGPASPGGDTPGCSQHPSDALSSPEDGGENTEPGAADSCIPTGNATSTSPDLRWTVQPTVVRSVSSSSGRAKPKAHGATRASAASAGANKAKPSNRKGQKEQPSKEDEERKRIRRERNKIAAAKCRNRRRELIDTLQAETDQLEEERSALQTEIADLLKEKDRLEQVLASHKASCKLPANDDDDEDVGDDSVLQEEPAAAQLLSIMEKSPQNSTPIAEAPTASDMDNIPCIPAAAAILGNSNILLCASAGEEALQDLKGEDLDDLVPSLEVAAGAEMPASVPDIDLSGPFSLPDWDTLYKSVANDLESLNTPLMSSSPTCSNYRTVFSFNFSEIDSLAEGCESFKGSFGASEFIKESLDSPTLLAL